jgi:hypothetical protein
METNKSAYYKADARLTMKKEELFKQGNISKFEISPEEMKKIVDKSLLVRNKDYAFPLMMSKETCHVHLLRQNYAYYSTQFLNEFERIRMLNGQKHRTHIVGLSQSHSDILADVKISIYIFNI